ncbi:ATP-binding protein [Amycolatopsis sp. NPDC003731]
MQPLTDGVDLLIGRDGELSRLANWVHDVAAGRGRAVLVDGEPGIGKSALVQAACAVAAQSGCQIFRGAGDELGQALPLLPILDALRITGSAPDPRRGAIAGLLRGDTARGKGADLAAAAAEQLLTLVDELCQTGPVVLVVDELQWADRATVAVWGRLARSVRQLPLLLIGVLRPVPRRDDLRALRGIVGPAERLRVGRLTEPAVLKLVAKLAGGKPGDRLEELAGDAAGNPLYLTELLDALTRSGCLAVDDAGIAELTSGPTPDSLPEAIADRLDFLSEQTRAVLRTAALLGVGFSVADLTIVAEADLTVLLSALDEARAAGVLVASGDDLAFRHPLIRTSKTNTMKAASARSYGLAPSDKGEYDHLISLELGGAPDDPRNLWVEPGKIPNPKDAVENKLHSAVCSGLIQLAPAQKAIAGNWVTAFDTVGLRIANGKVCLRDNPTSCVTSRHGDENGS